MSIPSCILETEIYTSYIYNFFVPSLNFPSCLPPQGSVFVIEYDPWSNLPFFRSAEIQKSISKRILCFPRAGLKIDARKLVKCE